MEKLYKIVSTCVTYVRACDKDEAEILFFDDDYIANEYEIKSIVETDRITFGIDNDITLAL